LIGGRRWPHQIFLFTEKQNSRNDYVFKKERDNQIKS
jgi:hypothetical protein